MKRIIYTTALLFCIGSSFAQPSLQSANLVAGPSMDVYVLQNVTLNDLLASGPNVIWDISAATDTFIGTLKFESMTGNPHAATYPAANMALKRTVGGQVSYSLFKVTATKSETVATSVGNPNETSYTNYIEPTPLFPILI